MVYLIWLQLVINKASSRINEILKYFTSAENVYKSKISERISCNIFTKSELEKMRTIKLNNAENIIERCKKLGIEIIGYFDNKYPKCLRNIENPPLVLYCKGDFPDFDHNPTICIVGPRNVSEYGKKAAFSLSSRLARAGFIVISGGATGCDTYVHSGVLKYNGITVLVTGCGINVNYPVENDRLRKMILEKGCIISEFPPDTPALSYNFPIRNRIMSAISCGTVVVEAGKRSGALITAAHANNQGKDVFVIPGSPDKHQYQGSNALLRDGAKPLLDTSDIFNEYIMRFPDKINIENAFKKNDQSNKLLTTKKLCDETLSLNAKIVYNHLDSPKFYPDNILNTGLTSEEIISALTELEISFLIKAIPGGMYKVTDR